MEKNKPKDEELRRFREEAAKLLEVEDQSEDQFRCRSNEQKTAGEISPTS